MANIVEKPKVETPIVEKKANVANSKAKGKSLPKNQKRSQVKHLCYHCGIRGHTKTKLLWLHALKRADLQRAQENEKGMPKRKAS